MKAIETRYDGHRFRSRTEARYAALFNNLRIPYAYELDGYVTSAGPYLPDFYLPRTGTWVEVKGAQEDVDTDLLVAAARDLPAPPNPGSPVLILVGPIEMPSMRPYMPGMEPIWHHTCHTSLGVINGTVCRGLVEFEPGCGVCCCRTPDVLPVAENDMPAAWECPDGVVAQTGWLSGGHILMEQPTARDIQVAHAYQHARYARFEHGEKG